MYVWFSLIFLKKIKHVYIWQNVTETHSQRYKKLLRFVGVLNTPRVKNLSTCVHIAVSAFTVYPHPSSHPHSQSLLHVTHKVPRRTHAIFVISIIYHLCCHHNNMLNYNYIIIYICVYTDGIYLH